jgi:hypothetical protein
MWFLYTPVCMYPDVVFVHTCILMWFCTYLCVCIQMWFLYTPVCIRMWFLYTPVCIWMWFLYTPVCLYPDVVFVPTCMYPDVVFVVGGASEGPPTPLLVTDVGTLASVSTDVDFSNVGCSEGSLTALKGALKGPLP